MADVVLTPDDTTHAQTVSKLLLFHVARIVHPSRRLVVREQPQIVIPQRGS